MSEKTEADEITELFKMLHETQMAAVRYITDWRSSSEMLMQRKRDLEDALLNRIRSIISDRDALRAAMQSHRKELR